MPTRSPRSSTSGPPELPWFTGAWCWMVDTYRGRPGSGAATTSATDTLPSPATTCWSRMLASACSSNETGVAEDGHVVALPQGGRVAEPDRPLVRRRVDQPDHGQVVTGGRRDQPGGGLGAGVVTDPGPHALLPAGHVGVGQDQAAAGVDDHPGPGAVGPRQVCHRRLDLGDQVGLAQLLVGGVGPGGALGGALAVRPAGGGGGGGGGLAAGAAGGPGADELRADHTGEGGDGDDQGRQQVLGLHDPAPLRGTVLGDRRGLLRRSIGAVATVH